MSVITLLLDLQQQISRVEGTQIVMAKQLASADDSRRILHTKIDEVKMTALAAANRADAAALTLAAIKPTVEDYENLRANMKVGLAILGVIGTALVAVLGYVAVQIWNWLMAHITWN